ncbi:MAG: tetratricopeptide repeat protein [Planctomycetota bacterium]
MTYSQSVFIMNDRQKAAQEWFKKATEAMNHKNWGYAIEALDKSCRLDPENVMFRQVKHGNIRKSYNENGTGAKMAGMRLMGVKGRIKKSRMSKDWKNIELAAEEGLLTNPWDAQLFFDLGEACDGQGNKDVARYALEKAVELDKENAVYNRRLGDLLVAREDFKAAEAVFERLAKLLPLDGDIRTMLNRVRAQQTIVRGRYEGADSTRDVKVEQPAAAVNAYEEDRKARKGQTKTADAPGESAEADLLHAIRKDPGNVNLYLKLADLYKSAREFGKAQDQLTKALEISGNNSDIREQMQEVQLLLLRKDAADAEEKARQNPGKERLVEKAKSLKAELVQKEIEFYTHAVENNPTDLRRKLELAQRLFQAKEYSKAIPLLQQAVANPSLKVDALVLLGECFTRDGKLDLARRQFEKALEGLNFNDRPDAFRNAHYWLGRIYEKAGKVEQAENHYNEVLAVDYEFRDVLDRLQKLQGGDQGIAE